MLDFAYKCDRILEDEMGRFKPVLVENSTTKRNGGNTMEWLYFALGSHPIIVMIVVVLILAVLTWVGLERKLPKWAEERRWNFFTVKKGRICLSKTAGKGKRYVSNLLDENKYVDPETGLIKEKDDKYKASFFWEYFGVEWAGFGGSVYEYPFEKTTIVDGKLEKIKTTAGSIFLKNQLVVVINDAETKEMAAVRLVAQVDIETVHAGKSLNFENWIAMIERRIQSACRDYIATKGIREVTVEQIEKEGELFNYVVKTLNDDKGNPGLISQVGQRIRGFSVMTLEIADETVKNALLSEEVAEEENKGKIAKAEGDYAVTVKNAEAKLEASKKEAESISVVGNANNAVLEKTAHILGINNASDLKKAEVLADAIKNGKVTTLALGETPLMVSPGNTVKP